MAIKLKVIEKEYQLGVWEISETEEYFKNNYTYSSEALAEITGRQPKHRMQLFAARAVLFDMRLSPKSYKVVKDENGKPHIVNIQGNISFSHSHEMATAIYSKNKLVGVDIQIETPKINRIAKKFISQKEFEYIEAHKNVQDYYHILWGAKESLYKAYGRRKVEFRDNLYVYPFEFNEAGGKIEGMVNMPDYMGYFDIFYQKLNAYYLISCIEKSH